MNTPSLVSLLLIHAVSLTIAFPSCISYPLALSPSFRPTPTHPTTAFSNRPDLLSSLYCLFLPLALACIVSLTIGSVIAVPRVITQQPATWEGPPRGLLELKRSINWVGVEGGGETRQGGTRIAAPNGENQAINVKPTRLFFSADVHLHDKGDWGAHRLFYFPVAAPLSLPSGYGLIVRRREGRERKGRV